MIYPACSMLLKVSIHLLTNQSLEHIQNRSLLKKIVPFALLYTIVKNTEWNGIIKIDN